MLNFPPFPSRVEPKELRISEVIQHFKKCFTDYDTGTPALQKMCGATGVTAQLSLPFPGGKWVAWNKLKIRNIFELGHRFSSFVHHVFAGNDGY